MKQGVLSVARWDLDECDRRGTWWLERPSPSDIPEEPLALIELQGRGTAVIMEELDRFEEAGGDHSLLEATDHLALVFHRFLSGEISGPFSILLNERPLVALDPFLRDHTRGQALHEETIVVDGHSIKVSPFVLPFPSRLKPGDLERAGGRDSLKTAHGFYIYRGGRLVVPGGWFRIVPADDLVRLARIQIDVPVELDHLWKVDIRKTVAEPPKALRPHLKRIVGDVATRSRKVYTHKGIPEDGSDYVPLWKRFDLRDEGATWRINRDHPLIKMAEGVGGTAKSLDSVLKLLEDHLPIHDIHIHTANDHPIVEVTPPGEVELETLARQIISAFSDQPEVSRRILSKLPMTEPFNRNPDAARNIAERLCP
jgi:hypothetical protein